MLNRRRFLGMCASSLLTISLTELFFQMPTSSGSADREIPVLLYHRVGYTSGYLTVTPERFSRDLSQLKASGYTTITLPQFQNFLYDRNVEMPEKPVLITFDDGYLDNYENAFPLLLKYNMVATFFVITGLLWTQGRLTPQHLIEMQQGGMSFGSHTLNHRALGELAPLDAEEELNSSRSTLESILNVPVQAIAYPRGSYNSTTINLAETNGYIAGFTTKDGTCSKYSPYLELRRIPVFSYTGNIITLINNRKRC